MVERRKAMQAWSTLHCGFMGRSPDHVASTFVGQRIGIEVFEKHGAARAKALRDYFEEASRNDYFLTYVIINPQAERAKDWGNQAEGLVAKIVDEDSGGITVRGAKAIGTTAMPPVREQLGVLAANVGMVHAMLAGMEADGTLRNGYWVPNRHMMYAAQVLTQDLYPRVIGILRELAGGALIMLPSSIEDYSDPKLAKIIRTTQRASKMEPDEKVKFMKAAWDAVGSEFGSRHTQYEMFYAGAKFVTTGHSFRTFDWAGATGMVDALMAGYDLADEFKGVPDNGNEAIPRSAVIPDGA